MNTGFRPTLSFKGPMNLNATAPRSVVAAAAMPARSLDVPRVSTRYTVKKLLKDDVAMIARIDTMHRVRMFL